MKKIAFFITSLLLFSKVIFAQLQVGDKAFNFTAINQKGGELFSINKNIQHKVLLLFSNNPQDLNKNMKFIKKEYKKLLKNNIQIVVITTNAIELTYFSYIHYPNVHKVIYDPQKQITDLYQVKESVIGYCIDESRQVKAVLHKKS